MESIEGELPVVSRNTSWICSKLLSGFKRDFEKQNSSMWILLRLTDKIPSASVVCVCVCVCCVSWPLAGLAAYSPCSPGNSIKGTQRFDMGSLWSVTGKRRLWLHDLTSLHCPDSFPERIYVKYSKGREKVSERSYKL